MFLVLTQNSTDASHMCEMLAALLKQFNELKLIKDLHINMLFLIKYDI